jgi:hypothetical protein
MQSPEGQSQFERNKLPQEKNIKYKFKYKIQSLNVGTVGSEL